MSAFLTAEQLEHAAHNLHMHETGFSRDWWAQLTEDERSRWREKALAKLGDYAMMSKDERQQERDKDLAMTLSPIAPAAVSRDTEGREAYLAERYGNGAYAFALSVLGLLETNESTMSVYEHALLVLKSRAASVPEGT